MRHRDFLLFVTLSVVAPSAFGQNASDTQSAAAIPDFSGIWAHPFLPGFEPPRSGAGPVVNKARVRQFVDADGRRLPPANAPLVSSVARFVGDYTNPILNSHAVEVVKKRGEIELSGAAPPTPNNQCWSEPVPYIFWNLGMQMLQQPDKIRILYDSDHEVRHVRMNQPHPAQVTPSWYGDSVGHYEGDTLVIDTVGIKADRPHAMIDWFGTPYTEALHVVERYRLLDIRSRERSARTRRKRDFPTPGQYRLDTRFQL